MARLNTKPQKIYTHERAPAQRINSELQLRRSVMACMLWESQFYEHGESIADRITKSIPSVKPEIVADIAIEAREKMKLRHVPLLLVREMARLESHKALVATTLERVIQRPDELTEFLAIYWKNGRCPLSAQVKKGLARAFTKFNEYQLAKYNRPDAIKLRDVLFLSHAKPKDTDQAALWMDLINDNLSIPDTWETELSAGKDKKATWERLLKDNRLGGLALLRNLRNMQKSDVREELIFSALEQMKTDRILPFRFIAAARYAPQWEHKIELAMLKCLEGAEKLPGKTVLLVDVSGSMDGNISAKSEMLRIDAACGLAILAREICENISIFSFSNNCIQVPPRHGFALRDALFDSQDRNATYLGNAIQVVCAKPFDRLIVITDEQSHDSVPQLLQTKAYMINVGSYQNGIGYGAWTHIDGWSDAVLNYIIEFEKH